MRSDGLVLGFNFKEAQGAVLHDLSPYRTNGTISGADWVRNSKQTPMLDFVSSVPDYVEVTCPQCDFTSGDFSVVMRVRVDSLAAGRHLACRGLTNTDGWQAYVWTDGTIYFRTTQSGANQNTDTAASTIIAGVTYTLGISRSGAAALIYVEGSDATDTAGTHIDPATSSRTLKLGVYDNKSSYPHDGLISALYIYNRALDAAEMGDAHEELSGYG